MDQLLNVFTLNCWGIPFVSKNRHERIKAIANYLKTASHNIVCLQEIWSEKDYLYLQENIKCCLPYSHYFYSGVLGSGLCIFSKWLIQDVFFHQWPLNGYIHKIHHGDWFGGKGVGLCRIKCNDILINVYCTHLHAEYHEDDIYLAHRVLQAYSTAEFVKLTSSSADLCILAGDLNTAPGDLSFRLITQVASLMDSLDGFNGPLKRDELGTCDNINNSYSDKKQVKACPGGKRIDHILLHNNPMLNVEVISYGNPLEDRVPGEPFSYSDHNAVYLELKLKTPNDNKKTCQLNNDKCFIETISEAIKVCRDATVTISKSRRLYLLTGGLIFMFLISSVGYWPNNILSDIIKIVMTGICFYYIVMGTLWNRIEMNSLKAGLNALENVSKKRE